MISQTELKSQLRYDPDTGVFTWLVSKGNALAGSVAGAFDGAGYRRIMVNGKRYKAHRLAFIYMTGNLPPDEVDHINQQRDDNRWENLRHATRSQNQRNCKRPANNTSGFNGVSWNKKSRKWQARIMTDGKMRNLGFFDNLHEAASARSAANKKYHYHQNHGRAL